MNDYSEIPWDAINYIVSEANYGGRVSDPKDRRLINVILKQFYSDENLLPDHKYTKSGVYFAPDLESLSDYISFIEQLP